MRVVIDKGRCTGHGRCYATAPEVFAADDDGYGLVELDDVGGDLVERARIGSENCPERAISLVVE